MFENPQPGPRTRQSGKEFARPSGKPPAVSLLSRTNLFCPPFCSPLSRTETHKRPSVCLHSAVSATLCLVLWGALSTRCNHSVECSVPSRSTVALVVVCFKFSPTHREATAQSNDGSCENNENLPTSPHKLGSHSSIRRASDQLCPKINLARLNFPEMAATLCGRACLLSRLSLSLSWLLFFDQIILRAHTPSTPNRHSAQRVGQT